MKSCWTSRTAIAADLQLQASRSHHSPFQGRTPEYPLQHHSCTGSPLSKALSSLLPQHCHAQTTALQALPWKCQGFYGFTMMLPLHLAARLQTMQTVTPPPTTTPLEQARVQHLRQCSLDPILNNMLLWPHQVQNPHRVGSRSMRCLTEASSSSSPSEAHPDSNPPSHPLCMILPQQQQARHPPPHRCRLPTQPWPRQRTMQRRLLGSCCVQPRPLT